MSGKKKEEAAGAPAWVMTFADLMSLLMCFFVLLLSFSEMDVRKFKQLAGSMDYAFGVQREIEAMDSPKGTSYVAQEFSAGKPEPTVKNEIKQSTTEVEKIQLDTNTEVSEETQEALQKIKKELGSEIEEGKIEIEGKGSRIVIRIMERGSFPSGSAVFHEDFLDTMNKISRVLTKIDGSITVAGHTDNVPINTEKFRSNWELSSARAVSVTHALLINSDLDPIRFVIVGHGDTRPRVQNDTPKHKAMNRRVEIIINKTGEDQERQESLKQLEQSIPSNVSIDETGDTQASVVPPVAPDAAVAEPEAPESAN